MSRGVLGALVVVLAAAVVLALWYLLTRGDDGTEVATTPEAPRIVIPTSTPVPTAVVGPTVEPTPSPVPTPVPAGFEACGSERAPLVTATYIVDTLSTPLNQRAEPKVDGELLGTFAPSQSGLVFTGECLVNLADGYVWWKIHNGSQEVWVASDFVTPN